MGFGDVLYLAKPQFRGDMPDIFYRLGRAGLTGQDVSTAYPTTQDGRQAVGMTFGTAGAAKNNRRSASVFTPVAIKAIAPVPGVRMAIGLTTTWSRPWRQNPLLRRRSLPVTLPPMRSKA